MNTVPLHVLLVEDAPEDRLIVCHLLTRAAPGGYTVTESDLGADALAAYHEIQPDCVLLDYHLPDMDGLDVLAALRASGDVPVVMLTGVGNESLAAAAFQGGAQDYLTKNMLTPERLHQTIQHAVATVQVTRERDQTMALLTTVLDTLPVGVAVFDNDLHIRMINPALATMLGQPATALPGHALSDLWPTLAAALAAPCVRVVRGNRFSDLEIHLPATARHDARWLSLSGTPVCGPDGGSLLGLITAQDITARQQAEAALRASETRYRMLFETIAHGIIIYDPTGRITMVNPAAIRILGIHSDQIVGYYMHPPEWSVIREDGTPMAHDEYPTLVALRTQQEVRDVVLGLTSPKHTTTQWVRIQAVPLIAPGATTPDAVYAMFEDITAQRQAQQALAYERQQLAAIVQTMHEGVIAVRPDETFALINPAALRMRSLDPALQPASLAELVQMTPQRLYNAQGQSLAPEDWPLSRVLRGESFVGLELCMRSPGGTQEQWEVFYGTPVYDEQGQLILGVVTAHDITQRKLVEAALREHEAQLQLALDAADLGIWHHDLITDSFTLDARASTLCGMPSAQVSGATFFAAIHPDDMVWFAPQIQAALDSTGVRHLHTEFRVVHPDGSVHWLANHVIISATGTTADRRVVEVLGISQDITERKAAEAALHAAYTQAAASAEVAAAHAARLDSLLAHAPIGIALLDRDLCYQHINASLAAMNGLSPEAHLGRSIREVLPTFAADLLAMYTQVLTTGEPLLDIEIVGESPADPGTQRTWQTSYFPVRSADGMLLGAGVVVMDITERLRTDQALRDTERKLGALFALLPVGISILDAAGSVVYTNPAQDQIVQLNRNNPAQGVQQRHRCLRPDGTIRPLEEWASVRALHERQVIPDIETGMVTEAGEVIWISVSAVPIDFADWRVVAVMVDITARKQAEEAIIAEYNRVVRLKNEFMATMSHELRTPLNAVLGQSQLLLMGSHGPLSERQTRAVQTIEQSGQHLLALINDILDYIKFEAAQIAMEHEKTIIEPLCRACLRTVAQDAQHKQITLTTALDRGVAWVWADERRLRQILLNLLTNAIKFTPTGGEVGLEVRGDPVSQTVIFTVWDTGIGIAESDLPRLFQPFVQIDSQLSRTYSGTGLGLALVRQLVAAHGGSITVESTLGQGSRFHVTLPWDTTSPLGADLHPDADSPVAPVPLPAPLPNRPGIRILLVEDSESNIGVIQDALATYGYTIVVARDGISALEQVRANPPSLILLDIQLPVINGLAVMKQIRADPALHAIPIIALTALVFPGDRERCLDAGATAYFAKPVNIPDLLAAIAAVLPPADTGQEAGPG